MSSARSNAAARSRRAGGADIQQGPGQGQGQGPQNKGLSSNGPVKLSVSDAIGLITLRLGRVEQMVQNMPVDQGAQGLDENARIVDDKVFTSIVKRLDTVEKAYQELKSTQKPSEELKDHIEVFDRIRAEQGSLKHTLLMLQSFTIQMDQKFTEMCAKMSAQLQEKEKEKEKEKEYEKEKENEKENEKEQEKEQEQMQDVEDSEEDAVEE